MKYLTREAYIELARRNPRHPLLDYVDVKEDGLVFGSGYNGTEKEYTSALLKALINNIFNG